MAHRRPLVLSVACAIALAVIGPATVGTSSARPVPADRLTPLTKDMVPGHPDGKKIKSFLHDPAARQAPALKGLSAQEAAEPTPPPKIGDTRTWAGLDDEKGRSYPKQYTLRGVGKNIEVWVASGSDDVSSGLQFPAGDCRNDERTQITDQQVQYLMSEYDGKILPKESEAFSVAPSRDGSKATAPADLGLPADYYKGDGNKVVTLVDNVRDANFYDPSLTKGNVTYIAGFFYSVFNEAFDRNVMTIDGYDWLHRTGANPPDEPVPGNLCASKPARPYSYESTFAHEYQHLLEYYQDPAEVSWVNEGLSMYAEQLTGYATPAIPVDKTGFDAYIQCILGNTVKQTPANPNPRPGGPENSLTVWGDQGQGSEILCDYGAAFSFMLYLDGRFGEQFLSDFHRDKKHGLASLDSLLAARKVKGGSRALLHQWSAMLALDAPLEQRVPFLGGQRSLYSTPTIHAAINWDNERAYSTPGAPPNGSDYVRLRGPDGKYLSARDVKSIDFKGSPNLPTSPVEWTVDANPPDHAGNPALFSGSGENFDRAAIRSVTVPAADPTLTFASRWDTEARWDYGFVQVSTDGGKTWTSLANSATTSDHDPGAIAPVVANLPGFTGSSNGWTNQRFDLTAYAGKEILLSFRYITDPGTNLPGWWVDDVAVGGVVLSDGSSLNGFRSASEVNPTPVAGFTVQLLGYSTSGRGLAFVATLPVDQKRAKGDSLPLPWMLQWSGADVVAAVVSYDEPTETITQYAPYQLRVNGVVQPGGGQPPAAPAP